MANLIITARWTEPTSDTDAKVVFLDGDPTKARAQHEALNNIIEWAEEKAGQDWGHTIPAVEMFGTQAIAGDLNFRMAVDYLASNLRYDTGEGIYDEDCETLAELGIVRS